MMKRLYCILTLVAVLMLAGSLHSARAQVPARISYQGLVLTESGATLSDGTYAVTFRLYTEEEGIGQALWSETQTVPVHDGLFSTMIGLERALDLPFDQPYYLTVQLEGQAESERMVLSAAAYALVARDVPDNTVVRSISGLKDAVELVAGEGIAIQQRDNQLIISARHGLKGYGPGERAGSIDFSPKKDSAGRITEEEDERAIEAMMETFGGGGSNLGLDAAYDAGRTISLDDGRITLLDASTTIGFEVRNTDMLFRDALGGNAEFRFRVDGVSPVQVWKMRLEAATGGMKFVNSTGGTKVPFHMTKDATNKLLTLEGSALVVRNASGTTTITLDADFGGDGRVITEELEITGGSDLSENFDVSGGFGLAVSEPGMVVSIDPSSPGRLTISGTPYDRMVAGVVSGAGGIETGLIMGQRGSVADGATPVALTGRVYVFVDAAYGAVAPGDLLTSSATAGHAMKVSDYGRSQGATLGKAMTGLSEGRGLVLMLVSLQ